MIREKVKQRIKFSLVILGIAIVIAFAIFTVMKYEVEGEKVVPFNINKVFIISSATTVDAKELESKNEQVVEQEASSETSNEQKQEEQENQETQQPQETAENQTAQENQEQQATQEGNQVGQQNQENAEPVVENENYIWNEKAIQTNIVCINLTKNEEFKQQNSIKSVKIENVQILKNVNLGKIQLYMPNSLDDGAFKYTDDYIINSSLTYNGANEDNKKNLEICSQGGWIFINFANIGLGEFKSNDELEIKKNASILEKMNISDEDLKFRVSFDLIIEVQDKSYKTNLVLDLPADNLIGNEETHKEINDFKNIVFKRM